MGKVDCHTYGIPRSLVGKVFIGDLEIPFDEFFYLVRYVVENTDLEPDDFRIKFLEWMRNAKIVDGWEGVALQKPVEAKRLEVIMRSERGG